MSKNSDNIEAVEKTLRLLEIMSAHNGALTVTQIAGELDCSVSSANRFLQTMQNSGYVRKNEVTKKYELTYKVFSTSFRMKENDKVLHRLITLANTVSQKYDVSVNINTLFEKDAMLLYKVMRSYSKDMDFFTGELAPAYCTSSGKVLLSLYSEAELDDYFRDLTFIWYQSQEISEESLREELRTVRKQGFAVCDEEYISGFFSYSLPYNDGKGHVYAFTVIAPLKDKSRVFNPKVIGEINVLLQNGR